MTHRKLPLDAQQAAWWARYVEKYPNGGPSNPPGAVARFDVMITEAAAKRRERGERPIVERKKSARRRP
jgi:hypothetical protein